MPQFGFRHVKVAKYTNTNGTISYSGATTLGEAINMNLQLHYTEGRLYAMDSLREYLRKATGGTISVGVKYLPTAAQKLLFGAQDKSRTLPHEPTETGTTVAGLAFGGKMKAQYVGVACYAPDLIDGVEKYTCIFVAKALFGPPGYVFQTINGNSITFQTPTTTGEFMTAENADQDLFEVAVCETEADATAWVDTALQAGSSNSGG